MAGQDAVLFEVLEDGTVKVTTDQVSAANHMNADKLLAEVGKLLGGQVTRTKRSRIGQGAHTHDHAHAGGGDHGHTH